MIKHEAQIKRLARTYETRVDQAERARAEMLELAIQAHRDGADTPALVKATGLSRQTIWKRVTRCES